mmetsp:Transcript_28087/g.60840  ORF Transcript_28087/g.60840 Transcript_28087/m.60840 type:complete len:199 (+) Transcript_28087:2-598(+)
MSNYASIDLAKQEQPLRIELAQLEDALQLIVHSILFHRTLGAKVVPEEVRIFDLCYVKCKDVQVDLEVNQKVKAVSDTLKKSGSNSGLVNVDFFTTSSSILGERRGATWELWTVHVELLRDPSYDEEELQRRRRDLARQLEQILWNIVLAVNQQRAHIPRIEGSGADRHRVLCFPFDVTTNQPKGWTLGSILRPPAFF